MALDQYLKMDMCAFRSKNNYHASLGDPYALRSIKHSQRNGDRFRKMLDHFECRLGIYIVFSLPWVANNGTGNYLLCCHVQSGIEEINV